MARMVKKPGIKDREEFDLRFLMDHGEEQELSRFQHSWRVTVIAVEEDNGLYGSLIYVPSIHPKAL